MPAAAGATVFVQAVRGPAAWAAGLPGAWPVGLGLLGFCAVSIVGIHSALVHTDANVRGQVVVSVLGFPLPCRVGLCPR